MRPARLLSLLRQNVPPLLYSSRHAGCKQAGYARTRACDVMYTLDASFCSSLGFEKYLVHACKQFKRQGLLKAMLRIGERKNYIVKSWGRAKNTRSTGLWLSNYFCQGSRSNSWNFIFDSLEEPEHPISELHMLISIESSWRRLRSTRNGFSLHRENMYIELVQIFWMESFVQRYILFDVHQILNANVIGTRSR